MKYRVEGERRHDSSTTKTPYCVFLGGVLGVFLVCFCCCGLIFSFVFVVVCLLVRYCCWGWVFFLGGTGGGGGGGGAGEGGWEGGLGRGRGRCLASVH